MQLAENLEVIHGAQALRSRILSRRDLGLIDQSCLHRFRFGDDLRSGHCAQGQVSHRNVISLTVGFGSR